MSADWLVRWCGVHSFLFGMFHVAFWRLFGWRVSLARATLADRAIVQILNLRLIYVFFGLALLCWVYPRELHASALGRSLLLGMVIFWIGRTVEQFVFLRINRPLLHLLSAMFVLGAALFAAALLAH